MYYSRLLMLENLIDKDQIINLQNYLAALTPNSKKLITVSKIKNAVNISEKKAAEVLMKCNQDGLMSISYAARCPETGILFQKIQVIDFTINKSLYCYKCEEEHEISSEDVVVLFSLEVDVPPFSKGQLDTAIDLKEITFPVAPCDTLAAIKEFCETATKTLQTDMVSKEQASIKSKRLCDIDYKIKSLDDDVYKKSIQVKDKHKKVIAFFYIAALTIYSIVIYKVFTTVDDSKISCSISVTASILAYVSDKIINGLICTDLEIIKANKKTEIQDVYERIYQERKMIELGII